MSEEFIELEPAPSTEIEPIAANSQAQQRQVQARIDDIKILTEVLPNLRFNQLTNKYEWGSRTNPHIFSGDDMDQLTVKLAVEHNVYIPESRVKTAVRFAAKQNAYCPIKRYLLDCVYKDEEFEEWDSLGKYLIGNESDIANKALQRFFIGAVARAYNPGCSMSWMPIFIGKQGCGKSQLLRELVPSQLFAEVTVPIDTLMKEMYRLHIAWIIELPEVDNYFSVKYIEPFKNLVTTRTDEVRMPYQSLPISMERMFVLAGTSNRSEIFVDPSGNRRFLPLEIPMGFETPWRKLKDVRHKIWTSAVRAYERGESWEITSGELAQMHSYIQQFNISDPWEDLIANYVDSRDEVTTTEVLIHALNFMPQNTTRKDSSRVASILQMLGWRRSVTTRKDKTGKAKSIRLWRGPEPDISTSLDDI